MAAAAHALHARRLYRRRDLHPARQAPRRSARFAERCRQCAVLSGRRRPLLWSGRRADRPRRPRQADAGCLAAGDHREAVRARPRVGQSAQRADIESAVRGPDLSDRSLPGQGDGPEHPGAALRQRHLRAVVDARSYRPHPDHCRRDRGRRGARALLRKDRRAARHGAEPPVPAPRHDRDGAADVFRCGFRARQEDGAVPRDPPDRRRQCGARPIRERRGARPESPGLPARARRGAGFHHRDLCRAQARHRQLALGRRAVLSTHRQAAVRPLDRDRGAIPSGALRALSRHAGRASASQYPHAAHPAGRRPLAQLQRQAAGLRNRDRRREDGFRLP